MKINSWHSRFLPLIASTLFSRGGIVLSVASVIPVMGCTEDVMIHNVGASMDSETATAIIDSDTDTANKDENTDSNISAECIPINGTAGSSSTAIDVVMAVDNSAGMEDENLMVQEELAAFIFRMAGNDIDVRMTLITAPNPTDDDKAKSGICVAAPLGSGSCPDDTKLPGYLHVAQTIASKDALSMIQKHHDQWKTQIRPDSQIHFVVVSDDDADMSAEAFTNALGTLTPPITNFYFHTISASMDKAPACEDASVSLCCNVASKRGAVYQELAVQTGGASVDLCLQDFNVAFADIADKIISTRCQGAIETILGSYSNSASIPVPVSDTSVSTSESLRSSESFSVAAESSAPQSSTVGTQGTRWRITQLMEHNPDIRLALPKWYPFPFRQIPS